MTLNLHGAIPLRDFRSDLADPRDRFLAGDFNGDGEGDLLYYRPGGRYAGIYSSKGDGALEYFPLAEAGGPKPGTGFNGDLADPRDVFVVLDANGDGRSDFLYLRPGGGYAHLYLSNGDGRVTFKPLRSPAGNVNGFFGDMMSPSDQFVAMDQNGDGKSDFLFWRPGAGFAGVHLSNGDGSFRYVEYSAPGRPKQSGFIGDVMSATDRAVVLDINGDKRSDFLWYRPGFGFAGVYLSKDGTSGAVTYVSYREGSGVLSNNFAGDVSDARDTALKLDINGDGKDDFLWYRPGTGYADMYMATNGSALNRVEYSRPGKQANGWTGDVMSNADRAAALDIDGDGTGDILWYRPGSSYAGVYRSNGDGSVRYVSYATPGKRAKGFVNNSNHPGDIALPLDLNGDKMSDMFWYRPGGGYANAYLTTSGATHDLRNVSYLVHLSNWMEDFGETYLGDIRLRDMAIPGSHDAGTFELLQVSAADQALLGE